jgi:hypothetical protein
MDRYTRSVLIVERDPVERERLAAVLDGDGFNVMLCSGPSAPDYVCVGTREGRCPLATAQCVVVLDMDLDRDAGVRGTAAEELLGFYLQANHLVVTLGSRPAGFEDDRVLELRRHPETDVLRNAVWLWASPRAQGTRVGEGVFGLSGLARTRARQTR